MKRCANCGFTHPGMVWLTRAQLTEKVWEALDFKRGAMGSWLSRECMQAVVKKVTGGGDRCE